jgi:universal stress protein E
METAQRLGTQAFRRIAVATDQSPGSEAAVERAAHLARQHGARLGIVHVIPIGLWDEVLLSLTDAEASTPTEEALRAGAEAMLQEVASVTAAAYGVDCETRVTVGRVGAEIARWAAEFDADLLVLGAHGRHPVRDLLLGTTVQKLLRLSPCPVLVVKQASAVDYETVLAPTDLSTASRGAIVAAAERLPAARFHVAHAFELPHDGLMRYASVEESVVARQHAAARERLFQELAEWVATAKLPASCTLHVEHGYPPMRIAAWIGALGADLVVLAAHGKSPLEATFIGSVSLHTALTAPCDVLLMRGRGHA